MCLNLGCGFDIKKGFVNLDKYNLEGVDVVHDLKMFPYPFEDDTFDYILCNDIIEHLDLIDTMRELHRILKKEGTISIRVPHFSSTHNFEDPTHINLFASRRFKFFVVDGGMGRCYYFNSLFDHINYTKITFDKGWIFWNYLVESLVNISDKTRLIYEFTFLSRLFPAMNLEVVIQK